MWFAPGAAANSALTATLPLRHRTDVYGLLDAMPSVDYAQYVDENYITSAWQV